MDKIDFLLQQRERSRQLFLKTGDKSHLLDMNYFDRKIDKLEHRPINQVKWFIIGTVLLTIAAPFVNYLFFRLKHGG